MTPEAQIAAIASVMPSGFLEGKRWLFQGQWIVFDPLNDLNAMREALSMLNEQQQIAFSAKLVLLTKWNRAQDSIWKIANATCGQYAEALLRTLNLWTDEQ
jgi:hypothetical protein